MHYRMADPSPEIEAEGKRLYAEWLKLPRKTRGTFDEYRDTHCSETAKEYMRMCEEVYARLQPGEYV